MENQVTITVKDITTEGGYVGETITRKTWVVDVSCSNGDSTQEYFSTEQEATNYSNDVKNRELRPFDMRTMLSQPR